ncbi:type I-E CRISPR-associated protein Cas6/Cse3/CasE [Microbulbifer thermotolerans]|uniref:type I-E CRISPR-associated protein Cas6/Cse3/CasE n=1 Tax=Microbulbifer thermotolerans TaxID=252514 RepID=UPI00267329C7|nr:type I-E CRISPR-associated protein Cas6/Cse3/CasE [Microbulbifer thermotolerans]WKT61209.1 type I-E CRISPR-associated protein Cas6/Cse3/CasE [Microbulbifer thermotolerans]
MYLSRVRVATQGMDRNALVKLLAGDAYANHQLLWKLFTESEERPFLFRQEMEKEQLDTYESPRGLPLFYVLSSRAPVPVPGLLECESKPFDPQLSPGDRLLFKLRANPTVARKSTGKQSSRRHDVLMDAKWHCRQQGRDTPGEVRAAMEASAEQWLRSRCEQWGFSLNMSPQLSGYRQHQWRRQQRQIRFSSVDYEGAITVTDPERLRAALFNGVGRSRAFGCGMLMVRRG